MLSHAGQVVKHPLQVSLHGNLQLLRPIAHIMDGALDRVPELLNSLAHRHIGQVSQVAGRDESHRREGVLQGHQSGHIVEVEIRAHTYSLSNRYLKDGASAWAAASS